MATNHGFSMVGFGNVPGPSGGVVPLFREEIEHGGPINPHLFRDGSLFHDDRGRGAAGNTGWGMASGGEVFALEMGEPLQFEGLALKMIRLSGRSLRSANDPNGDAAIEDAGLRPQERLYQGFLTGGKAIGTTNPRIWQVLEDRVDAYALEAELQNLEETIRGYSPAIDFRCVLTKWVAGYSGHGGGATATVFDSGGAALEGTFPRCV